MSGSAEDQQRINNAPIPPWQTGAATPGTRSANTEQQLDHLLALFISMLLQQSQGGSETMQENRAPGSQHEHQGNPSPLTLMLMQIVMQLAQSPNGSTN
ncbi:hypothetical protein BJD12_07865 [Xanthomonas vesicatoria ATCC 35937]|nr:hypothetical protein BI313_10605 [Xanthomonas vesicatoria]APP77691.1 hypothetical protein BJD12_07865 [Xanthomonas vesicatoria ATCC 35937]